MTARRAGLAAGVYAAVTAAIGWPVLAALGTAIAADAGDPVLNAAILAWNAAHVPGSSAWFDFPIFAPAEHALVLSEHLLGISVLASPLVWLTGNPIAAYNLTLLLTYPLCGLAMFALVWRVTDAWPAPAGGERDAARAGAAFLAGLAFAFAPYRAGHLAHLQVLFVFPAPLALLALHRFLEHHAGTTAPAASRRGADPVGSAGASLTRLAPRSMWSRRGAWLALFGACWLLQGAANAYYLVYFSLVVGLWLLWFVVVPRRWRDLAAIAAAMGLASLPLLPVLIPYVVRHRALNLSRTLGEIASFGADIAAPLCAPRALTFWGWLRVSCGPEGELFPGAAFVLLLAAGAWAWRRADGMSGRAPRPLEARPLEPPTGVRQAPSVAESAWARAVRRVAMGIGAVYVGIAASVLLFGPWRLVLGPLRASASTVDKPLSVMAACLLVVCALSPRVWSAVRRGSTFTFYTSAAVVCWVLAWGPFPRLFGAEVLYQAPFAWLLQLPGVDGLRVPARFSMMALLCLCAGLGLGLAALLARTAPRTRRLVVALAAAGLLADGWTTIPAAPVARVVDDPAAVGGRTVLALPLGELERDLAVSYEAVRGGFRTVNGFSGYEPPSYEAMRVLSGAADPVLLERLAARLPLDVIVPVGAEPLQAMVEAHPGAARIGVGTDAIRYRLPDPALVIEFRGAPGRPLTIATLTATCGQEALGRALDGDYRTRWGCGPQTADHAITADLGAAADVGAVVQALAAMGADFPVDLIVETSLDGERWDAAWRGSPAAAVLEAALADPATTRAVVAFAPRPARYVRLRSAGRHPRNFWSIAELEVLVSSPSDPVSQ